MGLINLRLLCGLLLLILSAAAAAADFKVTDTRLRLLPGDLPAAGYFKLSNISGGPVSLVGAESPAFGHITMHKSIQDNGVARMEPVPRLEVAPGTSVEFSPGGYHLMLMKRQSPIDLGDEVTVTLVFADGQRFPIIFEAVSPASL